MRRKPLRHLNLKGNVSEPSSLKPVHPGGRLHSSSTKDCSAPRGQGNASPSPVCNGLLIRWFPDMLPVRNYGLDLLRILLCLTVVFFHYRGELRRERGCGWLFCLERFSGRSIRRRFHTRKHRGILPEKGWRLLPVLLIVWTAGFAVLLVEGQQATAWAGVTLLIAAPTLAMWKMMGNAAVWFIVCIMAFLALFPWLYRYYGKRPFLWLLAASVLFAAFRSGTVMDYGRLYYQVSFHLWQFLLGMWCASWNMEQWKSPWRWFWIGAGAAWLLASSAASHEGTGALNYSFPGRCFFRHLCPVHCLPVERPPAVPACLPLKWAGIGAGMKWRVDGPPVLFWESPCVFPWLSPISSISMWRSARWGRG